MGFELSWIQDLSYFFHINIIFLSLSLSLYVLVAKNSINVVIREFRV